MVYPHTNSLLNLSVASTANQTGPTYVIVAKDERDPIYAAVSITATQTGGGSSPTVSVIVETSADGTNWVELHKIDLSSSTTVTELEAAEVVGPFVRARSVLGGGTLPSHTCSAKLMTSEPIQLLKP